MKSRICRRSRRDLAVLVLIASLMPLTALGAASSAEPHPEDLVFYLFNAESLGAASDVIAVRFEYRGDDSLLRDYELTVSFGQEKNMLVPIPPLVWPMASGVRDIELLVFADGLLLARFDGESLLGYTRTLRQTHPELVAALAPRQPDGPARSPIRRITAKVECNSPCGGGCMAHQDYDCDGVANSVDNCTDDPNSGQEDCDGDSWGDVCDVIDGTFQASGPVETCMTDKDSHVGYFEFEHHVEQRLVDVSACNSPDRWDVWIRSDADCFNISDDYCCSSGIGGSISQIGDDPVLWCGTLRDQDFCH